MPLSAKETAAILDLRGLNCPLPVLKARKRLAAMPAGSRLWLETTDPLAVLDIPAFCAEAGHRLIKSFAVEGGGHRFLLERGEVRS
ncbi:MAG: response regulator SirA [Proteobacteria bacterium]|nr:MAG: response regulator SirA [Pseudomonadota bacterium]